MRRKPPLLRRQLLVWLLVPLVLLLVADAFVSYWVALDFSRRAYDRSLIEIAHEVALHLRGIGGRLELDMPDAARKVLLNDPDDQLYFSIMTIDGLMVAGEAIPAAAGAVKRGPRAEVLYDAVVRGEAMRVVELRAEANSAAGRPPALVRVAETGVKRRELAREILLSVIVPQVLLILFAGFIVQVGVARGLAPLKRLQRAIESRSPQDRSPVALNDVPAEVRPLLHSINGLLARLDSLLTLQTRFIADAAHQLKTPVAALQAQVELASRQDDPGRVAASIRAMEAGLGRLSRLVSQLLSLARNEPEAVNSVRLTPLDLNALALEVASSWVPEALSRDIDLGFEAASEPVMISGDALRLRELFDNLLDNAVRYSRSGGHVTVRVTDEPQPAVYVNDDGPSIPAHERTRVFERFHRLLGSSHDGSGLGLAIAREIARIHDASISLEDDVDGVGNTFSVAFPRLRGL